MSVATWTAKRLTLEMEAKQIIAQASRTLVMEKGVHRLTVKEIVDECHITRQAFYHHFENIPGVIRWMLQRENEQTMLEQNVQALFAWVCDEQGLYGEAKAPKNMSSWLHLLIHPKTSSQLN